MPAKSAIVTVLGQEQLLLPDLVHDALAANARAKYFFSLLQLARQRADAVVIECPDLHAERESVRVDDPKLDEVVARSRRGREEDEYRIPMARSIVQHVLGDIEAMLAPLRAAGHDHEGEVTDFDRRLAALRDATLSTTRESEIATDTLAALTSSDRRRGDSAHLLVVDVHKAIDALGASIATEEIAGAKVYAIAADDRPLVEAFMRGVHETEALKLGHPGLGTMATRSGPKLILENDVGETLAHVLLVEVEGRRVTITTTDVHLRRLAFFRRLLRAFPIDWSETRSRSARELVDGGFFYECIGTFDARDDGELARLLAHVGARLVFLIDWNRARKVLRQFVGKDASLSILDWAADAGVGHRALIELGGSTLIFDALAAVVRTPLRYGERLDDMLGDDDAASFLRFVLRTSSEGLRQGRSRSLLRAEIRAELSRIVHASGPRILGPVAEHAEIVAEMAGALKQELLDTVEGRAVDTRGAARVAREQDRRADGVVRRLRVTITRMPDALEFGRIVALADEAVDAIEEGAFLLTLLPMDRLRDLRAVPLAALGSLLAETTNAYRATVAAARRRHDQEMLEAADSTLALERRMDDAERAASRAMVESGGIDGKAFVLLSRFTAQIERAVDALTHATLLLRDRTAAGDG